MEQILLAYGLPKETVAAIMMLYKNTKVKVPSSDRDTDYFDIVAGDTLAAYLLRLRASNVHKRKRLHAEDIPQTITDGDTPMR